MRFAACLLLVLSLGLAGCGSDSDDEPAGAGSGGQVTTAEGVAAADVEAAMRADLESGGGGSGGGVVDLDGTVPKSVTCFEDAGPTAWRCRLTPTQGEPVVCLVKMEPSTRRIVSRTCGRIDN